MSAGTFAELAAHIGHDVEVVAYGGGDEPDNVAAECLTCGEVLIDFERPTADACTITGKVDCAERDCELHYMSAPLKLESAPMVCATCGGVLLRDLGGYMHAPVPGEGVGARRHRVRPVPAA